MDGRLGALRLSRVLHGGGTGGRRACPSFTSTNRQEISDNDGTRENLADLSPNCYEELVFFTDAMKVPPKMSRKE